MKGILHRAIDKRLQDKMDDADFIEYVTTAVSKVLCEIMNVALQETMEERPSDILDAVCDKCAEFFVMEFENLSPEHKSIVRQLKARAQI